MNYFKPMRIKEKILALALVGMLLLPAGVQANKYATVVNPQTGERKVVRVGDPHAFDGGFVLEVAYGYKPISEKELGFSVVSRYKTNLSTSMTSTQDTVPVASMETKDGHTLTMADLGGKVFLTIEPGGSKEEIVMCTGISGNYWTGCTRGLAFYATSTVTVNENRKSHIAGSIVIMSNVHYVYEQFVDKDTSETIEGVKTFTNYPRIATYTAPILNNEFVAKKYVDDVAVAGAPNAGTTTKGIVEIIEQDELGTGTTTGETGAELVIPNRYATTTSASGKYVVVTESDGKINQNFLDLNEDFAFGGEVSVTGTTTLATTTVSDLTIASGTIQQWPTASTSVATKGYVDTFSLFNTKSGSISKSLSPGDSGTDYATSTLGFKPSAITFYAIDSAGELFSQGAYSGTDDYNRAVYKYKDKNGNYTYGSYTSAYSVYLYDKYSSTGCTKAYLKVTNLFDSGFTYQLEYLKSNDTTHCGDGKNIYITYIAFR